MMTISYYLCMVVNFYRTKLWYPAGKQYGWVGAGLSINQSYLREYNDDDIARYTIGSMKNKYDISFGKIKNLAQKYQSFGTINGIATVTFPFGEMITFRTESIIPKKYKNELRLQMVEVACPYCGLPCDRVLASIRLQSELFGLICDNCHIYQMIDMTPEQIRSNLLSNLKSLF